MTWRRTGHSPLHWRHNDHDGVSDHHAASRLFTQPFIQTQIKEDIKAPRHWPLCGEFTGTGEFPAQRTSYAENVSIWWRHHVKTINDGDPVQQRTYRRLQGPVKMFHWILNISSSKLCLKSTHLKLQQWQRFLHFFLCERDPPVTGGFPM